MDIIRHTIGGKEYLFRFDMVAISQYMRMEKIPLARIDTFLRDMDVMGFACLAHFACKRANSPVVIPIEEFIEAFGDDMSNYLELVVKSQDHLLKVIGADDDEEEDKDVAPEGEDAKAKK
jgi:hypothetical protein